MIPFRTAIYHHTLIEDQDGYPALRSDCRQSVIGPYAVGRVDTLQRSPTSGSGARDPDGDTIFIGQ